MHKGEHLKPYHFQPGNTAGVSINSRRASQFSQLKETMLTVVTPEEMRAVWRRLLDLIQSDNGKVAVKAIELLYDRVFGKVSQPIDLQTSHNLDASKITDDQLTQVVSILAQAAPQLPPPDPVIDADFRPVNLDVANSDPEKQVEKEEVE